ncbi:MAG: transporter related protein [Polaromonas sp.]|nr:transporter related protein [Polaromonas sp.]
MHPHLPILKADRLCFGYFPAPAPLLFDQLCFELPPGVSFIGGDESSGKTTLLQLLAGELPASAVRGQLQLRGIGLAQNRPAYQRQVAWLDPRDTRRDQQTARQVFAGLPQARAGLDPEALQAHIAGLSLAPHLDKALFMMSSGTRRKVLLAASLASGAALTLLDQPFMALDRPSIDYLLQVLAGAARSPDRAWVVADYEAPAEVALASVMAL